MWRDAPGELAQLDELPAEKARNLARVASGSTNYVELVECRRADGVSVVVLEVTVERAQVRVHDIRSVELIAVVFDNADEVMPEALALREDFPWVPHLNVRNQEFPRSLCLYDEPYSELRGRWTPVRYLGRLRWWLANTVKGALHDDDQPLEPILVDQIGRLILPSDLLEKLSDNPNVSLSVSGRKDERDRYTLFARYPENPVEGEIRCMVSVHVCPPQQHGLIRKSPGSLADLEAITRDTGLGLVAALRDRVLAWRASDASVLDAQLVLLVLFPKTRVEGGPTEETDLWAFLVPQSILEIGEAVGAWISTPEGLGHPVTPELELESVWVGALNPLFHLSRRRAAKQNGIAPETGPFFAVGAGALGSQVLMNLLRAGFGAWTIVDNDFVLPHNLARHALDGGVVGLPKANCLAIRGSSLFPDEDLPLYPIFADVTRPGKYESAVSQQVQEARAILDMSASVSVARHLTHSMDSDARRVSLFLSPTGSDLVLLAEDDGREIRLDELEMQYYRAVATSTSLQNHLRPPDSRNRYGRSCRDVSSTIPQSLVGMHAGIATKAFQDAVGDARARICVWRTQENLSVNAIEVEAHPPTRRRFGDWTIHWDSWLANRLRQLRSRSLPNETGGVLLGHVDHQRKAVYAVDTIPSPPDSVEWPTGYIRGWHGLRKAVGDVAVRTHGMLEYVGEWHSHPDGCSTAPSADDMTFFAWLTEQMALESAPALMAIVGSNRTSVYLGAMIEAEQLISEP